MTGEQQRAPVRWGTGITAALVFLGVVFGIGEAWGILVGILAGGLAIIIVGVVGRFVGIVLGQYEPKPDEYDFHVSYLK